MTVVQNETVSATQDASDITSQENVAPKGQSVRQSAKQQVRHRASVACASCRDRRIRCVVPKGESECTQCKRNGQECVIKNDDERRRYVLPPLSFRSSFQAFFRQVLFKVER
jgi:hypothetical protein